MASDFRTAFDSCAAGWSQQHVTWVSRNLTGTAKKHSEYQIMPYQEFEEIQLHHPYSDGTPLSSSACSHNLQDLLHHRQGLISFYLSFSCFLHQ